MDIKKSTQKTMQNNSDHKNNTKMSHAIVIAGSLLALFTAIAASMIVFTHQQTADKISQNERDFILASLNEVMPVNQYDNDLIADSYNTQHSLLGKEAVRIYPAFKNNKPNGAIITTIAANGYNGQIKLLVGVNHAGAIHAVRVVAHKETPGLGDPIESKRSDWIQQFQQRSLNNPPESRWLVKKDQGEFDQLTGATVTPRAVVSAVKNSLLYYAEQKNILYQTSSDE